MAIRCGNILELESFKGAELVAGEKGLNRMLTWTYIVQTENVSEWVRGGELLFILRDSSMEVLDKLVDECVDKNLCGLVILVGTGCLRTNNIPQRAIDTANEKNIPIFSIPWQIKLIDLTKEIADLITQDKLGQQKSKNFLTKLISIEEGATYTSEEIADHYGMKLSPYGYMGILYSGGKKEKNMMQENEGTSLEVTQYVLDDICSENGINVISAADVKYVMFYVGAGNYEQAQKSARKLEEIYKTKNENDMGSEYHLALGGIYTSLEEIGESFKQAKSVIKLCAKIKSINTVVRYEELGLYRLLLKIKDQGSIRQYYRQQLEPLLKYDDENNQELVYTLKIFLINNGNLVKTSKALYIHRNTLIYRVNKIKTLLEEDLDDALVRQDLLNSIMAKEFLGE